jgi:hypothetical protein
MACRIFHFVTMVQYPNRKVKVRFQLTIFGKFIMVQAYPPDRVQHMCWWAATLDILNNQIIWEDRYQSNLDSAKYPEDLRNFAQKLLKMKAFW